jgi:hypothetical protein
VDSPKIFSINNRKRTKPLPSKIFLKKIKELSTSTMPYADPEKQIRETQAWRDRRRHKNALKKQGLTNREIDKLYNTIYDKEWRLFHLYKIRNKDGKLVTFKPNRAQLEFLQKSGKRNIILKSRQLGFTTLECIDNLDDALFQGNFISTMIFHTKQAAEDAFRNKISLAWENLPEDIKNMCNVSTDKSGELRFKQEDGVYSSIACSTSGRSNTFSRAHISEFGKMAATEPSKAYEVITGTFSAVPAHGRIDIESTAEGGEGLFYEMYQKALGNDTDEFDILYLEGADWKPFFFNWTYDDEGIGKLEEQLKRKEMKDPDATKKILAQVDPDVIKYAKTHKLTDLQTIFYWRELQSKALPLSQAWKVVKQEYPTTVEEAFDASDNKLFDSEKVNELKENSITGDKVKSWTYFKPYKPNHAYGIGVDVAEGVGQDSSAIVVLDFTKPKAEVVATYESNKIAPDILAYEVRNIAREYGNPIVAIERNNYGGGVTLNEIKSLYRNLYTTIRTDKLTNEQTDKLGWETNSKTKPRMFYDLKTAVDENLFIPNSEVICLEMLSYNQKKLNQRGSKEGETQHWDMLTATAIAYQMKEHAKPAKKKKKKESRAPIDRYAII